MNFTRKIATLNINSISCDVKKSLLKDFIVNNDLDIIFLQEVSFQNFSFIQSHRTVLNISDRGRGTAILLRNGLDFDQVQMSECGRIVSLVVDGINLICIYAKSGANFKRERNLFFMNEITTHFYKRSVRETIVGGDFNCILNSADSNSASTNFCHGLSQMINIMSLRDSVSNRQTERRFTFFRGSSASRLDRFYTSNGIFGNILGTKTTPTAFSDHYCFEIKIKIDRTQIPARYGFGYWKINPALLKNQEIINEYSHKLRNIKQFRTYEQNFYEWWSGSFKNNTKYFFKNKAIHFNRAISEQKGTFYRALLQLGEQQISGIDVQAEINFVKSKLMEIERQKIESMRFKFNSNIVCEEEKINIFQIFGQNKRSHINQLKFGDRVITGQAEIGIAVRDFFAEMFENSGNTTTTYQTIDNIQNSLEPDEADELLRPITQEEIRKNLFSSSKKKSPGPDGLNYEFYIKNFDGIKDDLVKLFNGFLENPNLIPSSFSDGVITLIPKNVNVETMSDLRPISLLNTDYKLFAKILASRIKNILPKVIGKGQTACLIDASCVENLMELRNAIAISKISKRLKFAIMSIDLEKAFDRVKHDYLWKCLEKLGFPMDFIMILQKLYSNAKSKIMVNGFLTNDVKIKKSVRQGCPLSMLLFVIYIEPLIRAMSDTLDGLRVGNNITKVLGYADDINFIVRNTIECDLIFEKITKFCEESGAKINLNKSSFLRINECKIGPQFIRETDKLKILGFFFCTNLKKIINANYEQVIANINFLINQNKRRNLNLVQKVWVANTFMLSKLWYCSQVVPPENLHIGKIKKALGKFLWKGHLYRIDRRQLCLPNVKGGLGLISIPEKVKSLFLKRNLYCKIDGFLEERNDFIFIQKDILQLPRNTKEALNNGENILTLGLNTTKSIYNNYLDQINFEPYIERKFPELEFKEIWKNLSLNCLPSDWRTTTYFVVNDVIANSCKVRRHRIDLDVINCIKCDEIDDNTHRIKKCSAIVEIWNWLKNKLNYNLRIGLDDPEELLNRNLNKNEEAGFWFLVAAIHYNINNYLDGSLEKFKNLVRKKRWSEKDRLEKKFGNLLNIF
jgi:Reverse transcriptase (RNA-dependent DNA polymerase)/Endonuclease/Exonuclease/phosphatase family